MDFHAFYLRKKFWINDFLHGSQMWKQFCDVMQMMDNQTSKGIVKRNFYLKEMLTFARHNVPFYMGLDGLEHLSDFPVVSKQDYLSDYKSFCTPHDKIPFQKGELHVQKTSGSTGTPFAVPQDTRCRTRRIAIIKAENEKIDFHSFEPMMHLRAVSHYWGKNEKMRYAKDLNIWYVDNGNLTEERIADIVETINVHRIKVVRGYMTTLDTITRFMEDRGLSFRHMVTFISVGELLQEWLRKRVTDYLNCRIISQYGNEENGIFGQSPINGSGRHIDLNGANCIVEILKLDSDTPAERGEIGRIVVTDFTNYAFPMIRYEIGDLASPCDYYPDGTIGAIDNLSGRITDMISRTNGEYVDIFNSMPTGIFNNPQVKQWQFIQKTNKQYLLRLSMKGEDDKISVTCLDELKDILGENAELITEYVNEIPVLNSGKRKIVINEWKRQ